MSNTPVVPSVGKPHISRHLRPLETRWGEKSGLGTLAVAVWLVVGSVGMAESGGMDADTEARLTRILELEREIAELKGELSPEELEELERRLRELEVSEPVGSAPAPADVSVAVEEPPRPVPAPAEEIPEPARSTVAAETPGTVEAAEPEAPRCGTLEILDTSGDGVVSGADRYWRYLSLWRDDGDGAIEKPELKTLFAHGIRRVSARLTSYTTAKDLDGGVWVEDTIYFDLPGRRERGVLVIDAGRLARGDDLRLETAGGESVEGLRALGAGLVWVSGADSSRTPVLCR